MADETKPSDLDSIALEIFRSMPARRDGEQDAAIAYRRAAAFQKVRNAVRKGELKADVPTNGPMLDDVCAPKLKRTHPFNLVSRQFGSFARIGQINKWLTANPTPESDPDELVSRLNREFPDLEWDQTAINTARAIFPNYVTN